MTKAKGPLYITHFRRRREGRTDYVKRLALLKGGKTRMVVRKTNKYIIIHFTSTGEKGDVTLFTVTSKGLNKFGFEGKCNSPSAYLTGLWAGKIALKKGINEFLLDIGLHTSSKGSIVFAALKGAIDAGLKTNYSQEILPSEERICGNHLNKEVSKKFEEAKKKILSNG